MKIKLDKRVGVGCGRNGKKPKAKSAASLGGSRARSPGALQFGGKLEGQNFRETVLPRYQNVCLLAADEIKHLALQRTNRSLAFCMANGHSLLGCSK